MSKLNIDKEFEGLNNQQYSKVSNVNLTTEEIIKQSKVEYSEILEPPPVCLEIVSNNTISTIGTMGTFSVIIGKAKSRKTFLTSLLISGVLRNDNINSKIKGSLPPGKKKVIFFDTEQPRYKVNQIQRRILKLSERNPTEDLTIHCLRPYSKDERIDVIKKIIYNTPGLGMIVIDGIRDLLYDINNSQEAVETTGLLMKWTNDLDIHCICVIHQNKGDNNARGHLGTELINKGDTIISVTKQEMENDLSVVEPEYCREKDFDPFAFKIDDNGLPFVVDDWKSKKQDGQKVSLSPHDIPIETHRNILNDIYSVKPKYQCTELQESIRTIFEKHGVKFGKSKSIEFRSYYLNEKMIQWREADKTKGERFPVYEKYI